MTMDRFTDMLVTLQNEGYDFSVFVKKRDGLEGEGSCKFSHAYVTPAAKQLMPLNIWDMVEEESILKQDMQSADGIFDYEMTRLSLANLGSLERYLQCAFKHLRQVPCKSIVKAWIKVIEPRKKTKFPYIKGELTKPDWWPDSVQHREPDHLQKDDRIRLMTWIILAVLPEQRDRMIFDDLRQTTLGLSLFKREPHKNMVLQSIFDISEALSSGQNNRLVNVIDLAQFTVRQRDWDLRTVKNAAIRNVASQDDRALSEEICNNTVEDVTIDSPLDMSAPTLIDLIVANDRSLLDVLGYSGFEDASDPVNTGWVA